MLDVIAGKIHRILCVEYALKQKKMILILYDAIVKDIQMHTFVVVLNKRIINTILNVIVLNIKMI